MKRAITLGVCRLLPGPSEKQGSRVQAWAALRTSEKRLSCSEPIEAARDATVGIPYPCWDKRP